MIVDAREVAVYETGIPFLDSGDYMYLLLDGVGFYGEKIIMKKQEGKITIPSGPGRDSALSPDVVQERLVVCAQSLMSHFS